MKPEDFKAKTTEILQNLNDQAKVSSILAELVDDYDKETVEKTAVHESNKKLTEYNEKLREANMEFFMQIGKTKQEEQRKQPEDNTPKFESLFDKDGNII